MSRWIWVAMSIVLIFVTQSSTFAQSMGSGAAGSDHANVLTSIPTVTPTRTFPNSRHVAMGIGMRNNTGEGAIEVNGVFPGSTVLAAYLYWSWASMTSPTIGLHNKIKIKRQSPKPSSKYSAFLGTQVGTGLDPFWLGGNNFVFKADVTSIVTGSGMYRIKLFGAGKTDGSNPFGLPGPTAPLAEGAVLVVVYRNSTETMGTMTAIYDTGLSGNMFIANPGFTYTLSGFSPVSPAGIIVWSTAGADGQYADTGSAIAREQTRVNGVLVAGPGSLGNDGGWNGADGFPSPQLHDTHSYLVLLSPGSTSMVVNVSDTLDGGPTWDCLVPVVDAVTVF